jgi:predicted RNase H-like nuclease (RuvC/YqgF family)
MRRNLGRSLLSFSFSRSNRIGSDELIALEKAQSHESREGLCVKSQTLESLPTSVNHLLQELAEKEMMINDLRRKLENLEQCEKSVMKKPSSMARSASIISGKTWLIVANDD